MHYVVAYDIPCDRRRRKILDTLKNYGFPVQLSVVECDLDAGRLQHLKDDLRPLLKPREDRVRLYALCETCYFRAEDLTV
jgi:CRISPR-associated protein Cas2